MPGFLKLIWCGCRYACVCVSAPGLLKTINVKITYQTSLTAFQFLCTALTIDTVDGWGLSNEARRVLLQKEKQGNAVFAIHTR